jgi:hypothetical protein
MYRTPEASDPILFGDVFSSKWLHDAFVREDAVTLVPINLAKNQGRGYAPITDTRKTDKDYVLAHGSTCRALLLSDDCAIETCLVRKGGRSRLIFAAVEPWPTEPDAVNKALDYVGFQRHPLQPADGFDGGIVQLVRLFAVSGTALVNDAGRLVCLEPDARAKLEQRWAAFATRRGPMAAADNATKLAHILDADGDATRLELLKGGDALPNEDAQAAARALATALTQGWRTEGEIMQQIADVHEAGADASDEVATLEAELRLLAQYASAAADQLAARAS